MGWIKDPPTSKRTPRHRVQAKTPAFVTSSSSVSLRALHPLTRPPRQKPALRADISKLQPFLPETFRIATRERQVHKCIRYSSIEIYND